MSWTDYNDFLGVARELYGLDQADAQEYYRDMREELGYTPQSEDLYTYPETATEVVGEMYEVYREAEEEAPEWVPEGREDEYWAYYEEYDEAPPQDYFEYALDEFFPDDEWLEEGDEIEVTGEITYE